MAINSRTKGAVGERELSKILQEYGYDAKRGQQFCGLNGDADVLGVPYMHIECKRVEKLNLENALLQSERDAREREIPVVMHRANRQEWKCTLRLDYFMSIWNCLTNEQRLRLAELSKVRRLNG